MTVLRNCVLVSDLEKRLYKGAIRKCRKYNGKILNDGRRSYIGLNDLIMKHRKAAKGLPILDNVVPLQQIYEEVPGITKRDAFRHIAGSKRAIIGGKVLKINNGVYIKVDEEEREMLETMTPFLIRSEDEAELASKRMVLGNMVVGFY